MVNKIKLLYVDDEPINLMLFKSLFIKKYDVKEAESGFKGLEVLAEDPEIQVVVSDMKMPFMDGIQFITTAKRLYPQIYFYILTGYEITREIQEALRSGLIINYFQKPFKMEEMVKVIEEEMMKR